MMELTLRTTVVLAVAFLVAAALRRATPATRHLLWHVTMLIVVAAPLLQPFAPRITMPELFTTSFWSTVSKPSTLGDPSPSTVGAARTPGTSSIRLRSPGAQDELRRDTLKPILLWASGFVVTGAWFAIGWLASLWIAGRAPRAPGALEMEARSIARQLGLKLIPDVRLMKDARGPLIVGIFRLSILLPPLALEWDGPRRRAVFAHELAHVRRADTRTQALAHMACALYWFNPLVWMATHALRRERERACDDIVIALGVRPSSYAQDLLEIARGPAGRFSPSAALAMARPTELEGRLLSVLASRPRTPARGTRWVLSAALCAFAAIALGAQPDAAPTGPTRMPISTARPPVPSLFYEDERQRDVRRREQNAGRAEALSQSPDDDVRERAALELALSGNAFAIEPLIAALDDTSGQVREKAAMGLALRSSPEVIEPLLRALRDPDAQVREKAAAGLSLRRDPRVVDALLVAISDSDAQVREKAAIALGTSGDPRALAALKAAMLDPDEQVREKAATGIVLLTSSPMGPIDRGAIESGLTWALNAALRAIR